MKEELDLINLLKFGVHLRRLREKKGLTQRQLGKIGPIDNSKIAKIENGKVNVTLITILTLANALGVSLAEMINFTFTEYTMRKPKLEDMNDQASFPLKKERKKHRIITEVKADHIEMNNDKTDRIS